METLQNPAGKPAFTNVLRRDNPEDLEAAAAELTAAAAKIRDEKHQADLEAAAAERENDARMLGLLQNELSELDEALKLAGKLSLDEAKRLSRQRVQLETEIQALEVKLGLIQPEPVKEVSKKEKLVSVWPTVAKISGLLLACWGIVIFSGDWILDKYPNAAIYNDVSFQKVLFGFSVFIAGIAAVIAALTVFFPGIGKYFNPFNREQLDFYNDFKTLSEWQRNLISIALFFVLLLAFVLTVSGKLD